LPVHLPTPVLRFTLVNTTYMTTYQICTVPPLSGAFPAGKDLHAITVFHKSYKRERTWPLRLLKLIRIPKATETRFEQVMNPSANIRPQVLKSHYQIFVLSAIIKALSQRTTKAMMNHSVKANSFSEGCSIRWRLKLSLSEDTVSD